MIPSALLSLICFVPQAVPGERVSAKTEVRYLWDNPTAGPSDRLLTGEMPNRETSHTIPSFAGKIGMPIIDFSGGEYPFPEGTIRPEDFAVTVGETSPTLALGDGGLVVPVTVRYAGEGVVWQPHPRPCHFLVIHCVEGCGNIDAGPALADHCDDVGNLSMRMTRSGWPGPRASGVVFCASIPPEAVREEYLDRWLHPGPQTNVSDEDFRAFAQGFVDIAKAVASRTDFVGDTWTGKVNLADYWRPRVAGRYAFRVGIYIYPSVKARNWDVPISDRKVIWSEPFSVEVR